MRLFKLIITLIILGLLGIFVFQNLDALNQSVNLNYNLYLVTKALPVKIYLLVLLSILLGFFMGLTVLMRFHFKTRRKLKRERIEKELAQSALTQHVTNTKPAASPVSNAPEPGTVKEG